MPKRRDCKYVCIPCGTSRIAVIAETILERPTCRKCSLGMTPKMNAVWKVWQPAAEAAYESLPGQRVLFETTQWEGEDEHNGATSE
jgi:hypothetical protein